MCKAGPAEYCVQRGQALVAACFDPGEEPGDCAGLAGEHTGDEIERCVGFHYAPSVKRAAKLQIAPGLAPMLGAWSSSGGFVHDSIDFAPAIAAWRGLSCPTLGYDPAHGRDDRIRRRVLEEKRLDALGSERCDVVIGYHPAADHGNVVGAALGEQS